MALYPTPFTVKADDTTGELWLVVEQGDGTTQWKTPLRQGAEIIDYLGNRALVTDTGNLKAVPASGLPVAGTIATGADTYQTVMTTPQSFHYVYMVCSTQPASISFDGGRNVHWELSKDVAVYLHGLDIPAGTVIQAKNGTPGSNFASLRVVGW